VKVVGNLLPGGITRRHITDLVHALESLVMGSYVIAVRGQRYAQAWWLALAAERSDWDVSNEVGELLERYFPSDIYLSEVKAGVVTDCMAACSNIALRRLTSAGLRAKPNTDTCMRAMTSELTSRSRQRIQFRLQVSRPSGQHYDFKSNLRQEKKCWTVLGQRCRLSHLMCQVSALHPTQCKVM